MSVVVLTGATKEMEDVLNASLPSKVEYCKQHDYHLKVITLTGDDDIFGNRLGFERMNRTFREIIEHDTCMWLDADAFITNYNYPMSRFIKKDVPFIASLDWTECNTLSTGNFILRKTSCSEDLFRHFIDFGTTKFLDDPQQEQKTINYIRELFPHLFLDLERKYLNAVPEIAKDYRIGEQREIAEPWDKSCFLAHLTTIPNEFRIKIIKENLLFENKH